MAWRRSKRSCARSTSDASESPPASGVEPHALSAVFLTHVHSDHLVGLADLAMTRWIQQTLHRAGPLTIVTPDGQAAEFARHMLDPYQDYHADTVALGGLAERAGVGRLVLTHLIPAPGTPEQEAAFERDVRDGGCTGPVTVGRDLMTFQL